MKVQLKILVTLISVQSSLSLAFFCPTNFKQINFGDTIAQVEATCGKPDKQKEVTSPNENVVQEWGYYNASPPSLYPTDPPQATMKTNVTFDKNGKAINITVNGIGVGSTTICGQLIQVGSTRAQVESACGKPTFVNKPNGPGQEAPKEIKTTEYTYNGPPTVVLIFQDGKLKDKK